VSDAGVPLGVLHQHFWVRDLEELGKKHQRQQKPNHYVLKSGCRIEQLQLKSVDRLQRALATYAIVAWGLLWLTYEAREDPNQSCEKVLRQMSGKPCMPRFTQRWNCRKRHRLWEK
jgi:hypothetical protein